MPANKIENLNAVRESSDRCILATKAAIPPISGNLA